MARPFDPAEDARAREAGEYDDEGGFDGWGGIVSSGG